MNYNGQYIGRFAPSPSGELHAGSLVAALGSYLQARSQGGQWLLRMEDLDPPREVAGAADAILRSLENHGLHWDGSVLTQSSRHDAYQNALEALENNGLAYRCSCTRKEIAEFGKAGACGVIYSGRCRDAMVSGDRFTWRVITPDKEFAFVDFNGETFSQNLNRELGDFIMKRADGFFAYQLAVVVDDAFQGVTEVVRGTDLLDNTPRQIYLQQLLGLPQPDYFHLPMLMNTEGQKLSKQTFAKALDDASASANVCFALKCLGQRVGQEISAAPVAEILDAAIANWQPQQCASAPVCVADDL